MAKQVFEVKLETIGSDVTVGLEPSVLPHPKPLPQGGAYSGNARDTRWFGTASSSDS